MPQPPKLRSLLGPSFLILAMGLGSGEIILWPYLVASHGLGLAWVGILGISLQYFINMEIERYALVTGESVFYGYSKLWRWLPIWFIVSSFIGFGLPGIIASGAFVVKALFHLSWSVSTVGSLLLIMIGIILSIGKTVYSSMEKITKVVITMGVSVILLLVLYFAKATDYHALLIGVVGSGKHYFLLPPGIALVTLFSAFVYSGAGGNLNLTQSIYIREKGYGMGFFSAKMSGLFRKHDQQEKINLAGNYIDESTESRLAFKKWWRLISYEHAIVFWFIGGLTILLLMLLSYVSVHGHANVAQGINFVLAESVIIGKYSYYFVGQVFLLIIALMLMQTQLGVIDSVSRIIAENTAIMQVNKNNKKINLSKNYYIAVWSIITFGIILFVLGASEPKMLLVLAGVINGLCMAVHVLLTYILNLKKIPKFCQPSWWRKIVIILAFLTYSVFAIFSVVQVIK